jgi:hypothetical protein
MSKLRVHSFSISIDGFGAGESDGVERSKLTQLVEFNQRRERQRREM